MVNPPTWLVEWSEIIAGFGTLLLTIFLVVLYKQQKDLFAENHRGLIDVVDAEFSGDEVTVYLSNFGNGVVTDLSLLTLIDYDGYDEADYGFVGNRLKRQDELSDGYSIQDGEMNVPFRGNAKIGKIEEEGAWSSQPLMMVLSELHREGVETVRHQFVVTGRDLTGKEIREKVGYGTEFNLQDIDSPPNAELIHHTGELFVVDDTFDDYLSDPTWMEVASISVRRKWWQVQRSVASMLP